MRKNRADPVHIMYSCDAFAKLGIKVTLVTPTIKYKNCVIQKSEIFKIYGLEDKFDIVELPTNLSEADLQKSGFIKIIYNRFYIHLKFLIKNRKLFTDNETLIYSKCFISTLPYIIFRKLKLINSKIVSELHYAKKNIFHKYILHNSDYVVASSRKLISRLVNEFKLQNNRIIKIPVRLIIEDIHLKKGISKFECRKYFNFTKNDIYIIHTGKVGKNMIVSDQFIRLSQELPDYKFIIICRNNEMIDYYNNLNIKNLIIFPFLQFPELNKLIIASDILLALYEYNEYNKYYLGPSKAGQYLFSGNPVILSDLPSLRERFSDEIAYFCDTTDISNVITIINQIINNSSDMYRMKIKKAKAFSLKHTYHHAAVGIIKFLKSR